jgi:hypothetical protein
MEKGEDRKQEKPTNTMMIGVVELVEEDVCTSLHVRYRRTKDLLLLRLVHPPGWRASQGIGKGKARVDAPR